MSGTTSDKAASRSESSRRDQTSAGGSELATQEGKLVSQHGKTSIADTVVAKIAGMAARDVAGVHDLGGGASRAFGAIRERIPGATSNVSQGVAVEVGERQAAVDLEIVVEYGVSITDLADAIRRNVIAALERMTGLEVLEVNINVDDIHLLGDDDKGEDQQPGQSKSTESRVQ